jgi:nucleotide-binding universal stress UspA family protein
MKAVVAVGFMDECLAGSRIFARLRFPDSSAVLVHTVEPVLPDGGFLPDSATSPIVEIQNQRREDGEKRMAQVAKELESLGVPCQSVTKFGNPAHEITALAEQQGADVIVAGSIRKGKIESFVIGSVARALITEAKRSVLVGKTPLKDQPKVDAVFATDHSKYANSCLEMLVGLAPKGLGNVTVVSADTTDDEVAKAMKSENPEGLGSEDMLNRKNEQVCAKLRAIAEGADSIVLRGRANDVINAVMEQTRADLLILGAHGHGFLERLLMGSTAMHMVGNAPWNVLVLRA